MEDDGEPPDQDVVRPGFVEGAADPADVIDRRRPDLRDVWIVIHAWASSKVGSGTGLAERPGPAAQGSNVC
jgi:hypothetical protein